MKAIWCRLFGHEWDRTREEVVWWIEECDRCGAWHYGVLNPEPGANWPDETLDHPSARPR